MALSECGRIIRVITDQPNADETFTNAQAIVKDGMLHIIRAGREVAWYADGGWIKVSFSE